MSTTLALRLATNEAKDGETAPKDAGGGLARLVVSITAVVARGASGRVAHAPIRHASPRTWTATRILRIAGSGSNPFNRIVRLRGKACLRPGADTGCRRGHTGTFDKWRAAMAQHAVTAVHYQGGKIDLVAVHTVVEKEFGSKDLALGAAQRISVRECAELIAAGEEVCLARRTEDHTWEVLCDVELLPGGNDITGVDIVNRPNDDLRKLPAWD
jgi:hypothetical protein